MLPQNETPWRGRRSGVLVTAGSFDEPENEPSGIAGQDLSASDPLGIQRTHQPAADRAAADALFLAGGFGISEDKSSVPTSHALAVGWLRRRYTLPLLRAGAIAELAGVGGWA
jgi:hypothetical protein